MVLFGYIDAFSVRRSKTRRWSSGGQHELQVLFTDRAARDDFKAGACKLRHDIVEPNETVTMEAIDETPLLGGGLCEVDHEQTPRRFEHALDLAHQKWSRLLRHVVHHQRREHDIDM